MRPERHVSDRLSRRVIVAAIIIMDGRVLACERSAPPEVAGRWEFPGGKVEPGETDAAALAPDVPLAHGRAVLRVFRVTLLAGDVPRALEHTAMRWLAADELSSVPWLPADAPIVAELPALLAAERLP
jgi:8-oxo-dGTP diphosphatase